MRVLFHLAVCLMLVLDFMAIILFLIWLCLVSARTASCFAFCIKAPRAFRKFLVQGVVVRPALAIPYFTGVAAFIGNIISLSAAIRNWQDTVINLALEKLQTFLDLNPFKSTLLSAIDAIIKTLGPLEGTIGVSPFFSRIPGEKLESVRAIKEKLQELRVFIASSDVHAAASASTATAIQDEAAVGLHAARRASSALDADALQRDVRDFSRLQLRKLKESEMVALFSNLWSSIRCAAIFLIRAHMLIFHSQRGAWAVFARYSHCADHVVTYSRPLPVVHFHRHRHFFRRDRSLCCHC
jgi:hypothetical protein